MKIAIDIGHANHTGATGNGLEEHEIAARIGHLLALLLRTDGRDVDIIDYPTTTNAADLSQTIAAANTGRYNLGISIHTDASDNPAARGAHVCFYPGSVPGSRLALAIAQPLCHLLPGRSNSVIARPGLAILKKTQSPWALVECGFITNPSDAAIMRDTPQLISQQIATGILNYINLEQQHNK